jgi:hypothetical protein
VVDARNTHALSVRGTVAIYMHYMIVFAILKVFFDRFMIFTIIQGARGRSVTDPHAKYIFYDTV